MWYVKAEWNRIPNCWWGAYKDKKTADELARRVNGTVYHESEIKKGRFNPETGGDANESFDSD